MELQSFDHVALWTPERDELSALLTECCSMHVIARTDAFTLVGGNAREGKVTLFAIEGPRERGVLERVVLRVPGIADAHARLADAGYEVTGEDGTLRVEGPSRVPLALVESATGVADLDSVVLRVPDPVATASSLAELGLERDRERLRVDGREIVLRPGDEREGERPLLNHLAFLVASAGSIEREARSRDLEVEEVVDAPNTLAVFLRGPDRLRLEYVEHKPGFSLE